MELRFRLGLIPGAHQAHGAIKIRQRPRRRLLGCRRRRGGDGCALRRRWLLDRRRSVAGAREERRKANPCQALSRVT